MTTKPFSSSCRRQISQPPRLFVTPSDPVVLHRILFPSPWRFVAVKNKSSPLVGRIFHDQVLSAVLSSSWPESGSTLFEIIGTVQVCPSTMASLRLCLTETKETNDNDEVREDEPCICSMCHSFSSRSGHVSNPTVPFSSETRNTVLCPTFADTDTILLSVPITGVMTNVVSTTPRVA